MASHESRPGDCADIQIIMLNGSDTVDCSSTPRVSTLLTHMSFKPTVIIIFHFPRTIIVKPLGLYVAIRWP